MQFNVNRWAFKMFEVLAEHPALQRKFFRLVLAVALLMNLADIIRAVAELVKG